MEISLVGHDGGLWPSLGWVVKRETGTDWILDVEDACFVSRLSWVGLGWVGWGGVAQFLHSISPSAGVREVENRDHEPI